MMKLNDIAVGIAYEKELRSIRQINDFRDRDPLRGELRFELPQLRVSRGVWPVRDYQGGAHG